jgi:catechol 2,3-dioxygenase-like lactoylglutathione lyase family enzyme
MRALSPAGEERQTMKRLHVHMSVENLDQSIRFYSTLFATGPTVVKPDYAKWMLEDPRVNFAISTQSGRAPGIEHLGIQVEDGDELQEVYGRLKEAEGPVLEEGKTTCCYAQSEKSWIADPQGVAWETFLTNGESTVYGTSAPRLKEFKPAVKAEAACCGAAKASA